MATRTQIELSRESLRLLCGVRRKSRIPITLTALANESIALGLPTMIKNLDKMGVLNGKK